MAGTHFFFQTGSCNDAAPPFKPYIINSNTASHKHLVIDPGMDHRRGYLDHRLLLWKLWRQGAEINSHIYWLYIVLLIMCSADLFEALYYNVHNILLDQSLFSQEMCYSYVLYIMTYC